MYTRIYVLRFPKETSDKPIVSQIVKNCDVELNILKADILLQHEGVMIIELTGHKEGLKKALDYLRDLDVKIELLSAIIKRDDSKCYECGACTGICPTGALHLKRPEMSVVFDLDKCNGCSLCVATCPVRAMEVSLTQTISSSSENGGCT
ncbi:MAG: NIL domain-containing protein [Desulfurivibrionaceae bacterium]